MGELVQNKYGLGSDLGDNSSIRSNENYGLFLSKWKTILAQLLIQNHKITIADSQYISSPFLWRAALY